MFSQLTEVKVRMQFKTSLCGRTLETLQIYTVGGKCFDSAFLKRIKRAAVSTCKTSEPASGPGQQWTTYVITVDSMSWECKDFMKREFSDFSFCYLAATYIQFAPPGKCNHITLN
jgi:hypothetical protein